MRRGDIWRIEKGEEGLPRRVEADVEGLEDDGRVGLLRQEFVAEQRRSLRGVRRGWLLQKDVLASLDRFHRPFIVQAVGESIVHDIDAAVVDQVYIDGAIGNSQRADFLAG